MTVGDNSLAAVLICMQHKLEWKPVVVSTMHAMLFVQRKKCRLHYITLKATNTVGINTNFKVA